MIQWRSNVCVTIALFLAACGGPSDDATTESMTPEPAVVAPAAPTVPEISESTAETVIVILGDSLMAGYNLAAEEALPEQIEMRLKAEGLDVDIVNAAVSGDTTRGGLERYDWSVKSADPDVLVLALGANDFLGGLSVEQARGNLEAIIQRAQSDHVCVVLAGVGLRVPGTEDAREEAFASVYPELSAEFGVPLYPDLHAGLADEPGLLQTDGLHPTVQGVQVMVDPLSAFLRTQLETWDGACGAD